VRGGTADAGERFCQANEIAFTYGDERATLATLIRKTGPRCLRSPEGSPIVEARWWPRRVLYARGL
jgi:hypothetical protein